MTTHLVRRRADPAGGGVVRDGRERPGPPPWLLPCVVPVAVVLALVLLALGGELSRPLMVDAGAAVRWGLPVARAVQDLAQTGTVGAVVLLATVLPPSSRAWQRAADIAGVLGVAWALGSALTVVLTAARVTGVSPVDPGFGREAGRYLVLVPQAPAGAVAALLAAAVAGVLVLAPRGPGTAALALAVSLAALVALSLQGHSGSTDDHRTAVTAWGLHLFGVGVWVGGLAVLALVARELGPDLPVVARRYSSLAGWSYLVVVVSGVVSAVVLVATPSALFTTSYGLLVCAKTASVLTLGAAGWWHRSRTLRLLGGAGTTASTSRPFWRLVAGELLLMAATVGLAVALAQSPSPHTGHDVAAAPAGPPLPLTPARFALEARPEFFWLVAVSVLVACYGWAVTAVRSRGGRWPARRTVSWLAGCGVLGWVTNLGPAAYADAVVGVHLSAHVLLALAVPALLLGGAPLALALAWLPRRHDGSRGVREHLLLATYSRTLALLTQPVVSGALLVGGLVAVYSSPALALSLRTHLGHLSVQIALLALGCCFAGAAAGHAPGAAEWTPGERLVVVGSTAAALTSAALFLHGRGTPLEAAWSVAAGPGLGVLSAQRAAAVSAWVVAVAGLVGIAFDLLRAVAAERWSGVRSGRPPTGVRRQRSSPQRRSP